MTTAPEQTGDYPDREIDCEEAMQPQIDMAMAAAEKAGWTRDEAAQALLRVATANYLSIDGGRTIDTSAVLGDLVRASRD